MIDQWSPALERLSRRIAPRLGAFQVLTIHASTDQNRQSHPTANRVLTPTGQSTASGPAEPRTHRDRSTAEFPSHSCRVDIVDHGVRAVACANNQCRCSEVPTADTVAVGEGTIPTTRHVSADLSAQHPPLGSH
jgi:hypothetical protein